MLPKKRLAENYGGQVGLSESEEKDLPFLAALCLFFSAIEYLVPKPLPFMRLGLANLPIILALYKFSPKKYFQLLLLKILCSSFIGGTFFSYIFLFSLCGSLCSGLGMFFLFRFGKKYVGAVGMSVCGSLCNNIAQIILSKLFLFKSGTKFIAPMLFTSGFVTGIILGFVAATVLAKSQWFKFFMQDFGKSENLFYEKTVNVEDRSLEKTKNDLGQNIIFFTTLPILFWFVFQRNLKVVIICVIVFYGILMVKNLIEKKKMPSLVLPLIILISVVICSLLQPSGKVLWTLGKLEITQGALEGGLRRGLVVIGTVFLSKIAVSPKLVVPGKIGKIIGRILAYFQQFAEIKKAVKPKTFFSDLDSQLLQLYKG